MVILSYIAIYLIWGSTFFFIASAVETIPPAWILAIRWSLGGLFFLIFSLIKSRGKLIASGKNILSSVLIGILLLIGGNGLITIAEKTIDSYVTALMISMVPLVVSLFNFLLFKIRITSLQVTGVITGFFGVSLLLYNGEVSSFEFNLPILLIIMGTISWALGTSLGAKLKVSDNVFLNSSLQMLTAGFFSLLSALYTTKDIRATFRTFSDESVFALIYLIIFGSLAIGAFNNLLRKEPSIRLTSYTLVNPVIATLLGIFFGGEAVRSLLFGGLPLILMGLGILLYGERLKTLYFKRNIQ